MIPKPQDSQAVTFEYVYEIIHEKMVSQGAVEWSNHLYSSSGVCNGAQYKSPKGDATLNVFIPKGTLHIAGKQSSSMRDELLEWVLPWTVSK